MNKDPIRERNPVHLGKIASVFCVCVKLIMLDEVTSGMNGRPRINYMLLGVEDEFDD